MTRIAGETLDRSELETVGQDDSSSASWASSVSALDFGATGFKPDLDKLIKSGRNQIREFRCQNTDLSFCHWATETETAAVTMMIFLGRWRRKETEISKGLFVFGWQDKTNVHIYNAHILFWILKIVFAPWYRHFFRLSNPNTDI